MCVHWSKEPGMHMTKVNRLYMIRLETGLKLRHGGVLRVCAIRIKLPLLLLHRIAVFQEIPFVSRPCPQNWTPLRYSWYPPHAPWYPSTVLRFPHGTQDIPPRYWTPPHYWAPHVTEPSPYVTEHPPLHGTEHTSYRVISSSHIVIRADLNHSSNQGDGKVVTNIGVVHFSGPNVWKRGSRV